MVVSTSFMAKPICWAKRRKAQLYPCDLSGIRGAHQCAARWVESSTARIRTTKTSISSLPRRSHTSKSCRSSPASASKPRTPPVLGIAGNAPNWQGRLFGAVGFVVPGPVKSKVVFGSEFLQEPRQIAGLPGARLPTTLTYFARVIPRGELPLNVDFGVAQVANQIAPGVKLNARSQFALGASYRV